MNTMGVGNVRRRILTGRIEVVVLQHLLSCLQSLAVVPLELPLIQSIQARQLVKIRIREMQALMVKVMVARRKL